MRLTIDEFEAAVSGKAMYGRAFVAARDVLTKGVAVRGAALAQGVSNTVVKQYVDVIYALHEKKQGPSTPIQRM